MRKAQINIINHMLDRISKRTDIKAIQDPTFLSFLARQALKVLPDIERVTKYPLKDRGRALEKQFSTVLGSEAISDRSLEQLFIALMELKEMRDTFASKHEIDIKPDLSTVIFEKHENAYLDGTVDQEPFAMGLTVNDLAAIKPLLTDLSRLTPANLSGFKTTYASQLSLPFFNILQIGSEYAEIKQTQATSHSGASIFRVEGGSGSASASSSSEDEPVLTESPISP